MNNLDDIAAIKAKDPKDVLGSTAMFPDQCLQAWKESSTIVFGDGYKNITNIVVCGMGGSRFTPKTIKELFRDRITKPYEIIEDYTLPAYVDRNSLVILSSYSGTTEEVLSCREAAIQRGARITAVSSSKMTDAPAYVFQPRFNPCGQPRIGGGYLLMGHLGILKSLSFVSVSDEEIAEAIEHARTVGTSFPSKDFARTLYEKHPFVITAEFLKGFGNGFANQINETAKMISDYRYISELNHHLMEGLKHPESLRQNGLFVFFLSDLYSSQIQKRFAITADVVKKQNIATHTIQLTGRTKLAQALEAFTISGFTTYYLAMLYDVDPVAIPWVDYFKAQLAKS